MGIHVANTKNGGGLAPELVGVGPVGDDGKSISQTEVGRRVGTVQVGVFRYVGQVADVAQSGVIHLADRVTALVIGIGHLTKFIDVVDDAAVFDRRIAGRDGGDCIGRIGRVRVADEDPSQWVPLPVRIGAPPLNRIEFTRADELLPATQRSTIAATIGGTGIVQIAKHTEAQPLGKLLQQPFGFPAGRCQGWVLRVANTVVFQEVDAPVGHGKAGRGVADLDACAEYIGLRSQEVASTVHGGVIRHYVRIVRRQIQDGIVTVVQNHPELTAKPLDADTHRRERCNVIVDPVEGGGSLNQGIGAENPGRVDTRATLTVVTSFFQPGH